MDTKQQYQQGANDKDKLYDFLNSPNFKELFSELIVLGNKAIAARTTGKVNLFRRFLINRIYSIVVIALFLGIIAFLSFNNLIDKTVTGTLIGGIIGYTLGSGKKQEIE